jgi:hypothetical protein
MASNCEDDIDLDVTMSFLNPGGFFYSQFSVEEQGTPSSPKEKHRVVPHTRPPTARTAGHWP